MNKGTKTAIGVALAVLLAGAAYAGINPANPGLPALDLSLSQDNNFFGINDTSVAGNQGSVMCVKCHTRNPGARTQIGYTGSGQNWRGSHFVTLNYNDTSEGGGYDDGTNTGKNVSRTNRAANRFYTAANATAWAANPEYGVLASADNVGVNSTDPNAVAAQMICESCHNIVRNVGANKLLARGSANDNALLCVGCHGDMDPVISAEWMYHPADNAAWTGTAHHRNSHSTDADTYYYGAAADLAQTAYDMIALQRAYWTGNNQMWSVNYGILASGGRTIGATTGWTQERMNQGGYDNVNTVNTVTGLGVSPAGNLTGMGAGVLICTNCHRAHNATSSTGATILLRGTDTTTQMGDIAEQLSNANAYLGLQRMQDKGGRLGAFNSLNPLCLACHR